MLRLLAILINSSLIFFHIQQVQLAQTQKGNRKEINNPAQALSSSVLIDEKSARLLFVDSLNPIEIIVSFASLSRWYDADTNNTKQKQISSKRGNENANVTAEHHDSLSLAERKNINSFIKLEIKHKKNDFLSVNIIYSNKTTFRRF